MAGRLQQSVIVCWLFLSICEIYKGKIVLLSTLNQVYCRSLVHYIKFRSSMTAAPLRGQRRIKYCLTNKRRGRISPSAVLVGTYCR
ncbi:hypothetical protein M404DRAFT_894143 [Pisolithus tinctorius Marx 270]|uniref:Uncharacterized protein n=1 Tax=Pisolithus tinctorius Marx 270 TaxID=870435 RepID=A0A0C3IKF9_PISTI|nr:hypothetical protein M404DRAFT_894143 [Pisolithus tinctorius Marx 270]